MTTITDIYSEFSAAHGSSEPGRTIDEVRDVFHASGVGYDQARAYDVFAAMLNWDWALGDGTAEPLFLMSLDDAENQVYA